MPTPQEQFAQNYATALDAELVRAAEAFAGEAHEAIDRATRLETGAPSGGNDAGEEGLVTRAEAARQVGVSYATVQRFERQGLVRATRDGRSVLVDLAEVRAAAA